MQMEHHSFPRQNGRLPFSRWAATHSQHLPFLGHSFFTQAQFLVAFVHSMTFSSVVRIVIHRIYCFLCLYRSHVLYSGPDGTMLRSCPAGRSVRIDGRSSPLLSGPSFSGRSRIHHAFCRSDAKIIDLGRIPCSDPMNGRNAGIRSNIIKRPAGAGRLFSIAERFRTERTESRGPR
jgi:hypothetical protein